MSTAPSQLLLALTLALSLTACSKPYVKPTPPLPPRVDCQQGKTEDPAPAPACSPEQCGQTWVEYVVGLMGGWTEERRLRRIEHQCVDGLKDKGLIR